MKRLFRTTTILFSMCSAGAWAACTPAETTAQTCLSRNIETTLEVRYGLHLHRSTWNIDLSLLDADNTYNTGAPNNSEDGGLVCWRAGEHDAATGRDVVYPIQQILSNLGSSWSGDSGINDVGNPYDTNAVLPTFDRTGETFLFGGINPGTLQPNPPSAIPVPPILRVDSYPGFEVRTFGGGPQTTWRGPIMCTFQTVLEKFSNKLSLFRTTVQLADVVHTLPGNLPGDPTSFPDLVTHQLPRIPLFDAVTLNNTGGGGGPQTLGDFLGPTLGWQDSNMLLTLVFGGREKAGIYEAKVQYNFFDPTP